MSQPEFLSGASQYTIATKALGLDRSFQPDVDTHLRFAITRRRKALQAFYAGPGFYRPRKLTIPPRKYCLALCDNVQVHRAHAGHDTATPSFAWTVSPGAAVESREMAFDLDRAFAHVLADAPLLHDGAIRSERLPAQTTRIALKRARDASIGYLAQIVVRGSDQPVRLVLWSTADRRPIAETTLGANRPDADCTALATAAMIDLTDPITGALPPLLALLALQARLAVAMTFFRFMATQDRARLVPSMACLNDIRVTHLDRPLTMALRVDAARANFEKMLHGSAPSEPEARSYSCIRWTGSAEADHALLRRLFNRTKVGDSESSGPTSFFSHAAGFLERFAQKDDAATDVFAQKMVPWDIFWGGAFQCAVAVELGRAQDAAKVFSKLQAQHPEIEDFAGRALVSMIPDKRVSGSICSNLATVF